MGRGGARYVYWLFIVIGSVLLVGRDLAFELLKIVFCIGLPIAAIWACWRFFRLLFDWVATIYVDAEVALSKLVIKHTGLRKLAQNCREPCRGDGGELPLFCGVDRLKRTVSGAKTSSSNSLDQKYPLPNRSAVGTQRRLALPKLLDLGENPHRFTKREAWGSGSKYLCHTHHDSQQSSQGRKT